MNDMDRRFTLEEILSHMPRKRANDGDYPMQFINGWNKCLAALKNNLTRLTADVGDSNEPTNRT